MKKKSVWKNEQAFGKMDDIDYISNSFIKSEVSYIFTCDCDLKDFSLDQIGHFNFNASAKYGTSSACFVNLDASPTNSKYSFCGTKVTNFNNMLFVSENLSALGNFSANSFSLRLNSCSSQSGEY